MVNNCHWCDSDLKTLVSRYEPSDPYIALKESEGAGANAVPDRKVRYFCDEQCLSKHLAERMKD